MQQFLINDRPSPDEYDYQTLHWWLKHPYGGAWDFRGAGSLTLDRPMNQLVMVAATSARTDPFIRWGTALLNILLRCIPWWKPEVLSSRRRSREVQVLILSYTESTLRPKRRKPDSPDLRQ